MDGLGASTRTQNSPTNFQPASGPRVEFAWDVTVDQTMVMEAVEALLNGPGVLLEGLPRSGKRTLAAATLRTLHEKAFVVDLGHPESNRATLALRRLLDNDAGLEAESRFQSIGIARKLLEDVSMGLPIVVFVPEEMHPGSHAVSVLSSLALANSIALLCLSTTSPSTDWHVRDELIAAVRLHRIRLHPLTLSTTHELLEKALHGKVSRTAAYQLWSASAGQLGVLTGLVQDWFEQGYLAQTKNSWIVAGTQGPPGSRSRAMTAAIISGLKPDERVVVELLSFSEEILLSTLMALVGADAVDSVYAKGLLKIRGKFSRQVRLGSVLHPELVAETTPPGRARELLKRFRQLPESQNVLTSMVQLAWERRAGLIASSELVCAAAAQALDEEAPELGLEILRSMLVPTTESDLLYLEGLIRAEYLEHASERFLTLRTRLGFLVTEPTSNAHRQAVLNLIRLELIEALLLSRLRETKREKVRATVARARGAIQVWSTFENDFQEQLMVLSGRLDLIEAEDIYRRGESLGLGDAPYKHPHLTGNDLIRWQFLHNRQSIRNGQIRLGLKRGLELVTLVQQESLSSFVSQRSKQEIVDLYLISGEWKDAIDVIETAWIGGENSPKISDIDGFYSSIVQLFRGHSIDAMGQLEVEIEQRRVRDFHGYLPLVLASAALAAARNRIGEAEQFLAELETMPVSSNWDIKQGVGLIMAIVQSELGAHDQAIQQLRENTKANAERGILNLELVNRMMMMRFGCRAGMEELLACSQKNDGSLADAVLSITSSVQDEDGADRVKAVADAWSTGNEPYSTIYRFRKVFQHHQPQALSNRESHVRRTKTGPSFPMQASRAVLVLFSSLTKRQQMIVAEAATGASNREIAKHLQIKVRTVEGHLYQIYQRVNIGSRAELGQFYMEVIEGVESPDRL